MRKIISFVFVLTTLVSLPSYAMVETIAAVVNDDPITITEVDDRISLVIAGAGLKNTPEIRVKLIPQVIRDLVEEQIKIQEAERLEISVSQSEVEAGFAQIARQNNLEKEQFYEVLKNTNINKDTLERQIRSQVAWSKTVQRKLRPKVNVTDNDVANERARMESNIGKTEYLVAEIFLPFETQDQAHNTEKDVRDLAFRLVGEIRNGAPFAKIAQQFSKAAGAPRGGDLGWIQEKQLARELDETLATIEKGQITEPIQTLAGYHILLVRDVRTIAQDSIPSDEDIQRALILQRLERLAQRYFLDLRSEAFIETRVRS